MPYRVSWHLPERIIYAELQGNLTFEDITTGNAALRHFIKASKTTVHVLIDVQQLKAFPSNIQRIYNQYQHRQKNTGCTILIGGTPVMQFTANILVKLFGVRIRFAASLDEAIVMLCRQDAALVEHITQAPIPDTLS